MTADITYYIQYLEQEYTKKLMPFTITIVMHKSFLYAKVKYSDLEYREYVEKVDWYQLTF